MQMLPEMISPEGTQQHQRQVNRELQYQSSSKTMAPPVDDKKQRPSSFKGTSSSMLARLHAGYFRISLSLGGQALLWKILSQPSDEDPDTPLLHVFDLFPSTAFIILWCLSLFVLFFLSILYLLKCVFHFDLVKREYMHQVGMNYLYAPWASWLILLQSTPILIAPTTAAYPVLWWLFSSPIMALDVKIYGKWLTTERNHLSLAANPTSQISLVGNLIAARAAAKMGWKEVAAFLFSLALVHYLVLYVTLYQRLAAQNRLPTKLQPVLFLFFAVPGTASLAWNSISGSYDTTSKMLFYLSLFLFSVLICRPALFRDSAKKFNIACWAFSFPITILAIASAEYAQKVKGRIASGLMLTLSGFSVLVFLALFLFTVFNITKLLRDTDPLFDLAKDEIGSKEPASENNGL